MEAKVTPSPPPRPRHPPPHLFPVAVPADYPADMSPITSASSVVDTVDKRYLSFTERINNNLISRYSNLDFPPHKTIQLGKYFISGMSPKIQLSIWKLKSSQQSCQNQIWNQMKQISTDRDWSSRGRYSSQYAICFRVGCLAIICRLP